MKRKEKVRDIVEVRAFKHLYDFDADPGLTISSYHFTDITSDLMGKWVDRIYEVKTGRGAAFALAGLRGVGKSHFIAVLAAVTSRTELRSSIKDSHVLSRIDQLSKRSLMVALVKRGSGDSLISELQKALADALSIQSQDLTDSPYDILLKAHEIANDTPLLIFIDTAFGRQARVDRDDGAMLSEIAEAAKNIGIFVGIALDDDVSGADGPNSSIARSYQIDFLDQEHLYRIVDRHIFAKNDSMLPVLKDIYSDYQAAIPGFKWSEQRFVSLYPMHPATLEISPLIRLFIQDFALLGFASEAAVKIMGRPAESLIGLDEMFGNVDSKLRNNPQLKSAFIDFDTLEREVVQKTDVQFRLQAKLILKGLFLLSLDGQGGTAESISASMMVFDERDPQTGLERAEDLLDKFAMGFPAAVSRSQEGVSRARYCLKIGINDDLGQAIAQIRPTLTKNDLWLTLLQQLGDRFPEIQNEKNGSNWSSTCTVEWRGGIRRGEIIWHATEPGSDDDGGSSSDWTIELDRNDLLQDALEPPRADRLSWKVAAMTPEETEIVARYSVLKSHPELRQRFGEGASTTIHLHSASVDKICQRVFFDDASLYLDELEFSLDCDLQSTHNLAQLFTETLRPIFERRYPSHPFFLQPLGHKEVTQLIVNFFGGADVFNRRIQNLAQWLAEPLRLAVNTADGYVPASGESLVQIPAVKAAFTGWSGDKTLYLSDLSSQFASPPLGLTREAQQLILAALVAQREIEFVTANGNRINHRSLDLQIIWDDVIGISKPVEEKYSDAKLLSWVRTLTGISEINSLDGKEDKIKIDESLQKWLADWQDGQILADYDDLPDESLSASSWRNASAIRKSLGSVANVVQAYSEGSVPIDECLRSVADLFLDSEAEFERKKTELQMLGEFTDRAHEYQRIFKYLIRADHTENLEVELARRELLDLVESPPREHSYNSDAVGPAWIHFKHLYSRCYQEHHQDFFTSIDRKALLREIFESKEWQQFEIYSLLSVFDRSIKTKVENLFREYGNRSCELNAADFLDSTPFCRCGFRLRDIQQTLAIPAEIKSCITKGVSDAISKVDRTAPSQPILTNQDTVLLLSASLSGIG
jgi:hypothetical protein